MKRYDIRAVALAELDSIRDYTREVWGVAQAKNYIAGLRRTFDEISQHPTRFPLIEGRTDGARKARYGSHLIVYVAKDRKVEIVRILHQRMDIDARLD